MHRIISCLLLVFWIFPTLAKAEFKPNDHPQLNIHRAAGAITIDGNLDDEGWSGAARADNFSENYPGDNSEPSVSTHAFMSYDDENLYFAIISEDDPSQLRATLGDRDSVANDDFVGIMLDTYGTGAWAYEFFINPLGVQMDLRWTPNGEDFGFDLIWESQGKITDDGWQVEVAIPFRSLRFPSGDEQVWSLNFWRTHPRESRVRNSWASIDRDDPCFSCQWGTLTGIKGLKPSTGVDLLPSVTAFTLSELEDGDDPTSNFGESKTEADFALGLRYSINSSYSAEGTINPDFSQVESDAGQIDANARFALFFPERRPFFQEGSDLYNSFHQAIYTRSINNPLWAGKLTGRQNESSVAFLTAQDEDSPIIIPGEEKSSTLLGGRSWSNVFRARRNYDNDSYLGILGTDRRFEEGGSGSTFGIDGMLRFRSNYQLEFQSLASYSEELDNLELSSELNENRGDEKFDEDKYTIALDGETFWGNSQYLSLERHARHWSFDVDFWNRSPTFRADNGFISQNDNRMATMWTNYEFQPNNKILNNLRPGIQMGRLWNQRGTRKDEWISPDINFDFKSQTNLNVSYLFSEELFGGKEHFGIRRFRGNLSTQFSENIQGGLFFEKGKMIARFLDNPVLEDGTNFSAWAALKPLQNLTVEPSFDFAQLDDQATGGEHFNGYILRTRMNYQYNREIFFRLVVQYNNFRERINIEPLLSYKLNPFSVFFLGSSSSMKDFPADSMGNNSGFAETERQFFLKFQYLFRS